jgi:succinoglycan biosynthesis transport protein ExoP
LGLDRAKAIDDRRKVHGPGILSYALEEPDSRFTESLRAIKVSFDLARFSHSVGSKSGNSGNVIAFTSTLPQEGKSTAAANFARLLAHAGKRVIMIDADFRHPALSNQLTGKPKLGLLQVLAGRCHVGDAICVDPLTGLAFLPVGPSDVALNHANGLLGSGEMKNFIETIRGHYDCVVVDLPPLAPIADVRTTAAFVNFYVYIVEWGRTKIDVVAHHLNRATNVHDRLLGVVLNKADVKQLDRYESYYGLSHYTRYSSQLG